MHGRGRRSRRSESRDVEAHIEVERVVDGALIDVEVKVTGTAEYEPPDSSVGYAGGWAVTVDPQQGLTAEEESLAEERMLEALIDDDCGDDHDAAFEFAGDR